MPPLRLQPGGRQGTIRHVWAEHRRNAFWSYRSARGFPMTTKQPSPETSPVHVCPARLPSLAARSQKCPLHVLRCRSVFKTSPRKFFSRSSTVVSRARDRMISIFRSSAGERTAGVRSFFCGPKIYLDNGEGADLNNQIPGKPSAKISPTIPPPMLVPSQWSRYRVVKNYRPPPVCVLPHYTTVGASPRACPSVFQEDVRCDRPGKRRGVRW